MTSSIGTELRDRVKIRVRSLRSGKPTDREHPTSDLMLEANVRPRDSKIEHSLLGLDWILQSGVDLNSRSFSDEARKAKAHRKEKQEEKDKIKTDMDTLHAELRKLARKDGHNHASVGPMIEQLIQQVRDATIASGAQAEEP